ncbi:hypothetical protein D3C86_2142350 [compost metagenome]
MQTDASGHLAEQYLRTQEEVLRRMGMLAIALPSSEGGIAGPAYLIEELKSKLKDHVHLKGGIADTGFTT